MSRRIKFDLGLENAGRTVSRALGLAAAWLITGTAGAASVQLTGVEFSTLAGDAVEVRLQLDGPVGTDPLSFTIEDPARIAVDLADTAVALDRRMTQVDQGDLRPMRNHPRARQELAELLAARTPQYALADVTVPTSGRTPRQVAGVITEWVLG